MATPMPAMDIFSSSGLLRYFDLKVDYQGTTLSVVLPLF
jgi:hypothetical protein